MTSRYLAVTGGASIGECGRLSQSNWLLDALWSGLSGSRLLHGTRDRECWSSVTHPCSLPSQSEDGAMTWHNKSAQSNLGRGPRRATVAHVRRKVLIVMASSKFAPKSTLPVDRSPDRTTCLMPGPVRPMMPRHPDPIRRFSIMQWTDGRTDAQTDRSFMGKFDRPLRYESDAA